MNKKGKFILGAGLGLGLGLLLAPKSGKETRKDLMDKCNELLNKVKNMDPDEVKENITENRSYYHAKEIHRLGCDAYNFSFRNL